MNCFRLVNFEEGQEKYYSLIVGKNKVKVMFKKDSNRVWCRFGYNKALLEEIKSMEGARWHGFEEPPIKMWTIKDSPRNRFQLAFLAGLNPYAGYDKPLIDYQSLRNPYSHQHYLTRFVLTRHYCIIAAEMGTGKTLAAIEAMEHSGVRDWWYVAPKSALNAVQLEFHKWKFKLQPELFTYDGLKKVLENWPEGEPPPQGVIFDESSRLKTPSSQRSQAAKFLADAIREYHGENGYVVLMSGSPAPKNPGDWWHQCEIACPGYIREGTHQKFIQRLAVTELNESVGGKWHRVIAWKDSEKRCSECGQMLEHDDHNLALMVDNPHVHPFKSGKNEVAFLYERMKGLVEVKLKKDCLELPDKVYRLVKLKPSLSTINAAKMITASAPSAMERLVRLRELSDGFQYRDVLVGKKTCPTCKGVKFGDDGKSPCAACSATGEITESERTHTELPTPKEEALIDLLDEHEDVGRLVVYAAFTASIDRVVRICQKVGWTVIRVDGRGWKWTGQFEMSQLEMLRVFQEEREKHPRIAFVGHPGSAGMGLTLTASPSIVYWSNDFNAESRIQSEDRIHRAGMDTSRGATIIDLIHLPTDSLVLNNLKLKRELQSITLGELDEALNKPIEERVT